MSSTPVTQPTGAGKNEEGTNQGTEKPQRGFLTSLIEEAKLNAAQGGGVKGLKKTLVKKGSRLVLSSQVWLHALPAQSCDLLLTLPPAHPHSQATVTWLIDQIRRKEPRLKVEVRYHSFTDTYGLYFTARYDSMLKGAELQRLQKPVKEAHGGGIREFSYDEADVFENVEVKSKFLSNLERSAIVRNFLEGVRAGEKGEKLKGGEDGRPLFQIRPGQSIVPALMTRGFVAKLQPLHQPEALKRLQHTWMRSFQSQPLEEIRGYFGPQIGMYFAWLGHYTHLLGIPAAVGVCMWWLGIAVSKTKTEKDQWVADLCFVIFAFFNCIWATLFLESWKRRQAELAYQWGTMGLDQELLVEPRPEFRGDLEPSLVSGRLEPVYPSWKRRVIRYCVSFPVIFICILAMFSIMLAIFELQEWMNRKFADSYTPVSWLTLTPKILLGVVVFFSDENFTRVASFLNNLENYRTDEAYENNLIIKIAVFQFVNSFLSLFYIAFYLQDMERLSVQLAALLITRQVIGNITEAGIPYIKEKLQFSRMAYQMTRKMSDDSLARHITQMKEARESFNEELNPASGDEWSPSTSPLHSPRTPPSPSHPHLPLSSSHAGDTEADTELRHRKTSSTTSPRKSGRLPIPEFKPTGPELTQAELESLMPQYTSPLTDFLEMFIQFGYVLLFSPAFPLAALAALLNNFLEIRVDAFKLCNTLQRPFGRRVEDIGSWMAAMEIMGVIGVGVNCALIGQSGLVQRLWPDMSWGGQILLVVILEHVILALKFGIALAIPDIPNWVTIQMAKFEFRRREVSKREARILHREEILRSSQDSSQSTSPQGECPDSGLLPRRPPKRPSHINPALSPVGSRTRSLTPALRSVPVIDPAARISSSTLRHSTPPPPRMGVDYDGDDEGKILHKQCPQTTPTQTQTYQTSL